MGLTGWLVGAAIGAGLRNDVVLWCRCAPVDCCSGSTVGNVGRAAPRCHCCSPRSRRRQRVVAGTVFALVSGHGRVSGTHRPNATSAAAVRWHGGGQGLTGPAPSSATRATPLRGRTALRHWCLLVPIRAGKRGGRGLPVTTDAAGVHPCWSRIGHATGRSRWQ